MNKYKVIGIKEDMIYLTDIDSSADEFFIANADDFLYDPTRGDIVSVYCNSENVNEKVYAYFGDESDLW